MYNEEVMCIYDNYFRCVANDCADKLKGDEILPMSGVHIMTKGDFRPSAEGNPFKISVFLNTNNLFIYQLLMAQQAWGYLCLQISVVIEL